MPLYDYECKGCGNQFQLQESIPEHERKEKARELQCPKCNGHEVKRVIESVFVTTSKKS